MKIIKTTAMRRLDAAKIEYKVMEYEVDENDLSGTHIAEQIGLACDMVELFVTTEFMGGRHEKRISLFDDTRK